MQYVRLGLALLSVTWSLSGCYESHALEALGPCGGISDPTDPPWHGTDARVWVRTEGVGAARRYQAMVFDSIDPGAVSCNDNVVSLEVSPEGAVVMDVGRFVDSGDRLRLTRRYRYDPEPSTPPLARVGAVLEAIETEVPSSATVDGGVLTLTLDGVERRFARLSERIATIDVGSQSGAEEIAELLHFALLAGWTRIPGWGSGGLTEYLDSPTHFACALRGDATIETTGIVDVGVEIAYAGCFDFQEISLAGTYLSASDAVGDGTLDGDLVYTLVSNPAEPASTVTGTLFLEGLSTEGFLVTGGIATLRVGVMNYLIEGSSFGTLELDRLFATP